MINNIVKNPFILFEIPNFIDDKTYESLESSFPNFDIKNCRDNDDKKFSFSNESIQFKKILENPTNKHFFEYILSKKFERFIILRFFFYYLRRRPRLFFKNILPSFFIKNKIETKIQYSYILNKGLIHPHTDGSKKLASLMLYFPKNGNKNSEKLGTRFWLTKNKPNYTSKREDINNFNDDAKIALPFKKKSLFGFIKNQHSWHAVEEYDISEDYIRKLINININII